MLAYVHQFRRLYHASESYYPNGAPAALAMPGAPAISYSLDGAGRANAVTAGAMPIVDASGTAYSAIGLTNLKFDVSDPPSTS